MILWHIPLLAHLSPFKTAQVTRPNGARRRTLRESLMIPGLRAGRCRPLAPVRGVAALAGLGLALSAAPLPAQSWLTLHSFPALTAETNAEGAVPYASLTPAGDLLYGVATVGGKYGEGTLFAVNTRSNTLAILHSFANVTTDGCEPFGGLLLSGGTLYGTTTVGGANGAGTVFSIATNGTHFTLLHSFAAVTYSSGLATYTNQEGDEPFSNLRLAGNTLYGSAGYAGVNGNGTLFALGTNGQNFRVLHTFSAIDAATLSNADGADPGGLVETNGMVYGVAWEGGTNGTGTVWALNPANSNFVTLHSFAAEAEDTTRGGYTNWDGMNPNGGLVLSGSTLFGTAVQGGTNGNAGAYNAGAGTLFALQTNGGNFHVLHHFTEIDTSTLANQDGGSPYSPLCLGGNLLYGSTTAGGTGTNGTVFVVSTNGGTLTVLHTFAATPAQTNQDGAMVYAGLLLVGNRLYGTASLGGLYGSGTLFELAIQPRLTGLVPAGTNLTLHAINGVANESYCVLASSSLTNPLSQWTPMTTNMLAAGGNFTLTLTNAVNPTVPAQFYLLQAQ